MSAPWVVGVWHIQDGQSRNGSQADGGGGGTELAPGAAEYLTAEGDAGLMLVFDLQGAEPQAAGPVFLSAP